MLRPGDEWRKSSRSWPDNACVQVRLIEGMVGVRNSRQPDAPVLLFTHEEWEAFLSGVANGEFSLTLPNP